MVIMTTTLSDPGLEKGGDGGEGGKCRNNKPCTQWDHDYSFFFLAPKVLLDYLRPMITIPTQSPPTKPL